MPSPSEFAGMVELVSKTELLAILNDRLRRLPGAKDAKVGDVIRLPHLDSPGNWLPDFSTTTSAVALLDVYSQIRDEFILLDK